MITASLAPLRRVRSGMGKADLSKEDELERLAAHLEDKIMHLYQTALLTDKALRDCLGYPSAEALRQAIARNTIPVKVFSLKNRRGKFALAKDVAYWLAEQSLADGDTAEEGSAGGKK